MSKLLPFCDQKIFVNSYFAIYTIFKEYETKKHKD